MSKEHPSDKDEPATKRFVEEKIDELAEATQKGFQHMEERQNSLEQTVMTVLEIVQNIDQNTRHLADHPERLANLEEDVFKLKLKTGLS